MSAAPPLTARALAMSSAGSTPLTLDRSGNVTVNFAVVQRVDAEVEEIIASSNFVTIYVCARDTDAWVRGRRRARARNAAPGALAR